MRLFNATQSHNKSTLPFSFFISKNQSFSLLNYGLILPGNDIFTTWYKKPNAYAQNNHAYHRGAVAPLSLLRTVRPGVPGAAQSDCGPGGRTAHAGGAREPPGAVDAPVGPGQYAFHHGARPAGAAPGRSTHQPCHKRAQPHRRLHRHVAARYEPSRRGGYPPPGPAQRTSNRYTELVARREKNCVYPYHSPGN